MDCHVFVIMDTIMTWNVWNAILLGGVCELIACPVCNLFVSFLVLMEITMTGMMKLMMFIVIAMKGPGAWFYSQPLLQTVCFTKELYRVSLRLNMIYTNLHQSCLFIFSLMVSMVRANVKGRFCRPTFFRLDWSFPQHRCLPSSHSGWRCNFWQLPV